MARLCLALSGLLLAAARAAGEGPLVGIYPTLPLSFKDVDPNMYYKGYQEWVEQFGARSLILPPDGDVDWYFERINAFLIPGGPTRPVPSFVEAMVKRAMKANSEGDYFPVWGTCLGFEWLLEATGGASAVELDKFDATDFPSTLSLHPEVIRGRMFRSDNRSVMHWLERENITYENHEDGVEPEHFERNPKLAELFDVVATSLDRQGRRYVAAVQGKDLPIYGVQFHPEKIRYVNNTFPGHPGMHSHVPKTEEARDAADALANFVVREARKNGHRADAQGASLVHIMI